MRVVSGQCRKLMIFAPPRHGKSQLVSRKFPSYYLGNFPNRQVIIASHTASLATGFCRVARDDMKSHGPAAFGYTCRPDKQSEDDWGLLDIRTGKPTLGGMRAFGVGGGILGEGAHLLVVDDPITGDDSLSPTMRQKTKDWWRGTAMDRLNPGGKSATIVMAQRLHTDDLCGWLLEEEGDDWDVLTLRAEAEEDDVLGRAPGEWLWPWGFSEREYLSNKHNNTYWWSSKYQQRPVPRGGGMIQTAWVEDNAVRYIPQDVDSRVRYWDRAATEGGGDYTVGVLMSRKGDHFYIEDVVRGQWGSTNRDRIIKATCEDDNRRHPFQIITWAEQEPGSSGKDNTVLFEKMLRPHAAHCQVSSGSKEVRADGLARAFGAGEVHVVRGTRDDPSHGAGSHRGRDFDWYGPLLAEMSSFPAGKHDDIVDACSGAFNKLAAAPAPGGCDSITESEYAAMAMEFDL
jgi:phage terminase large subunit-like protein